MARHRRLRAAMVGKNIAVGGWMRGLWVSDLEGADVMGVFGRGKTELDMYWRKECRWAGKRASSD